MSRLPVRGLRACRAVRQGEREHLADRSVQRDLGAAVAIEAQLGLITAGLVLMLAIERRTEAAEPAGEPADQPGH